MIVLKELKLDSIVAQLLFYKMIKSFCNIYYTLATATMLRILAEKNMFKIPLPIYRLVLLVYSCALCFYWCFLFSLKALPE